MTLWSYDDYGFKLKLNFEQPEIISTQGYKYDRIGAYLLDPEALKCVDGRSITMYGQLDSDVPKIATRSLRGGKGSKTGNSARSKHGVNNTEGSQESVEHSLGFIPMLATIPTQFISEQESKESEQLTEDVKKG